MIHLAAIVPIKDVNSNKKKPMMLILLELKNVVNEL